MKRLICLFTIVSIVWNSHSYAEINYISKSKAASALKAVQEISKKTTIFKAKVINFDSSDAIPDWHKKRNRKAVKPVFPCITNQSFYGINYFEKESILSAQAAYCFRLFPINEKRGPPSKCFIV